MQAERRRRGSQAEDVAAKFLEQAGWQIVGRNVIVGRDEIDILALDSGPLQELVLVEVRSASSPAFGAPEERVDRAKVHRLYRALAALGPSAACWVPAHGALPRRVDLVIVDRRGGRLVIRHMKRLEQPV